MCNRYSITNPSGIRDRFKIKPDPQIEQQFQPKYNLCPTETAPIVIQEGEDRILKPMVFGLIPSWAKDAKIATQCMNARAETIEEKPAYRSAFKKRRCLVVADGFYEWTGEKRNRLPLRFVLKNRNLFAFAGIWEIWHRPDGKDVLSFAIVTTEANEILKPIHDRMPVILDAENESLWMAPHVQEPKTLRPLLRAYPAEKMDMYRVDPWVNKAGNEGPKCVEEIPA